MAFWGVEVKPGKPYTHTHQADHGRLRIFQATLGNCDAAARTVLQCNVGNKIPIKLCSLNPKLAETCHLEIEFEEVDDVVFSVIGQSSIHLSGYYVRASSRSNVGDDESESYGEDIGHSNTDEEHDASEDSYESDFIDDREVPLPEKYGSDSLDDSDDEFTLGSCHKQKVMKPVVKRNAPKRFDSVDDDPPVKKPVVTCSAPLIVDSGSDENDNVPISVTLGAEIKKKSKKNMKKQSGEKDEKQSNVRTLQDGLMVEDLSIGNIDAKVASDSCKVYIKYVGMLKDGKIIESNVSEKPYKFKLGMRVGEKRKLTVPPSMLSGGKSVGEVPANSSVIYEIELVKVK
ncbi:Peptidyl-prolyl cis-trans isomerase FKBP43 [Zea mays]|uniref:peptidylprolyl isomerase n=1 Tax=Zea mays TaxID=4577 RepID=A0A3L6FTG8_MAIZE|nr:Peptidyl-prolyl cis-trans isomerase FKBP43 [Zea mays]